MRLRKWLAFLLLATVFWAMPAYATPTSNNHMKVKAGYEGYGVYGLVTPIIVELTSERDADVTVSLFTYTGTSGGVAEYKQEARLSAGVPRSVRLDVLLESSSTSLAVRVTSAEGVLFEQSLRGSEGFEAVFDYSMGGVGLAAVWGDDSDYQGISGLNTYGQLELRTARVSPQNMPDTAEAMRAFHVMYMGQCDALELSDEQRLAIGQWVREGGVLIADSGDRARQTAANLNALLGGGYSAGAQATADISDELARNGQYSLATGVLPIADLGVGETLASLNGVTLVRGQEVGSGAVIVAGFSMSEGRLATWPGAWAYFSEMIDAGAPDSSHIKRSFGRNAFNAMGSEYTLQTYLESILSFETPSVAVILLLLLAFSLLAGPLGYAVLKRFNKREWMWALAPLLAVVFSVGIYTVGLARKGNDQAVAAVSRISLGEGGGSAITQAAFVAPRRGSYTLEARGAKVTPAIPGNSYYYSYSSYYGGPSGTYKDPLLTQTPGVTVSQNSVARSDVGAWTLASAQLLHSVNNVGSISGSLEYDGDRVFGTLKNETGYGLSCLSVVCGDKVLTIEEYIASGGDIAIDLNLSDENMVYLPGGILSASAIFDSSKFMVHYQSAYIGTQTVGELMRGEQSRHRGEVYLMAWTEEIPVPQILVNGKAAGAGHDALLVQTLTLLPPKNGQYKSLPGQYGFTVSDFGTYSGNLYDSYAWGRDIGPSRKGTMKFSAAVSGVISGLYDAEVEINIPDALSGAKIFLLEGALDEREIFDGERISGDDLSAAIDGGSLHLRMETNQPQHINIDLTQLPTLRIQGRLAP